MFGGWLATMRVAQCEGDAGWTSGDHVQSASDNNRVPATRERTNNPLYEKFKMTDEERIRKGGLPQGYIPTEEEAAILNECRTQSFVRGILGGVVGGLLARRFAPVSKRYPFYVVLGGGGMYLASVSTQQQCMQKMLELENSVIGDALRIRLKLVKNPSEMNRDHFPESHESMPAKAEEEQYVHPQRDSTAGFRAQPPRIFDEEGSNQSQTVTYADLRRKHRESVEARQKTKGDSSQRTSKTLTSTDSTMEPDIVPIEDPFPVTPPQPMKPIRRNKYGDVME